MEPDAEGGVYRKEMLFLGKAIRAPVERKSVTEQEFEAAVMRIRRGDKDGLRDIYLAYVRFIYTVIYEITQSKENAEDITSEVFIKLWDALDHYQPGHGHKGYLATIARNAAIDFMRKAGREVLRPVGEPSSAQAAEQGGTETTIFDTGGDYAAGGKDSSPEAEVVADMSVTQALMHLSPEEREIVEQKVLADMTFKEIAQELQIPMGTVTWRYQAAIKKLRRCGYE